MDIEREWLSIIGKYSTIKEVFIICEETDPELKTNLQPLNEFRAALDHVMKLCYSYYGDHDEATCADQFSKLNAHLDRAFFDICDMACINYRNMIVSSLEKYDSDVIREAVPNYYSEIRPKLDTISSQIAIYRTSKGNPECDVEKVFEDYKEVVFSVKRYFEAISKAVGSLEELQYKRNEERKKERVKNHLPEYIGLIIAIIGIVIGALI